MNLVEGKAAKQLLALSGSILILAAWLLIAPHRALAYNDDYPVQWKGAMDSGLDDWGYYNRECTSFVAWRLHAKNGFEMPRAIGNAAGWGGWANSHGVMVDMNAAPGSVAWFANHVAWVESVSGGSITIEEYNHNFDGTYTERTVPANSVSGYIHFKDVSGSTSAGGGMASLTYMGSDHLGFNQLLKPNQYILSDDVRFYLIMQSDGNLVLYGPGGRAYWASNTSGSGAVYAVMQSDGNLVLYRSNWSAVWSSQTWGRGNSYLYMQNDGNLVVYTAGGTATWSSNTYGHSAWGFYGSPLLNANQTMQLNQYIRSLNRKYAVALQGDGNLVLYGPGYHVLWASGTSGWGAAYSVMQGDGNLVLYTSGWRAVWSSQTWGRGNSFLVMQDDGNLVVYTQGGKATWSSGTGGRI